MRCILRLLLVGLVASTAVLAPRPGEEPDILPLRVGYDVAHADGAVTWTTKASLPSPRHALGVAAANGKVFAIGGITSGALSLVHEYDPGANAWSARASMPTARFIHGVATGANGKIYAIGGHLGGAFVNTVEEYDPGSNSWAGKASMPTRRGVLGVVAAANGKIYAIGGALDASILATVEEYDPSSNTWTTKATMPTARAGLAAVATPDGKIYAIGGCTVPLSCGGTVATVEEYDTSTDTWRARSSMPTPRSDLAAVLASNGRIYAIGGSVALATVEVYDPSTDSWSAENSILVPRSQHGAAIIGGWKIYVVGGAPGEVAVVEEGAVSPPPLSSVSPLSTYQTSPSFPVSWSGTPATDPIASYDIQYKDGVSGAWTGWITSTTALSSTFAGGQEGHTYYFQSRARDTAADVESYPGGNGDAYTTVDLTAPAGALQSQGWSSPYISNTVSLSISATDATSGLAQMQFGADGLTFNPWEAYGTSSLYQAPPGAAAVYGRFKDNAGNVSQAVSATITLDATPPSGTVSVNSGAAYAAAISVTLTLSATDSLSGMSGMSLSDDGSSWSNWHGYAEGKSWSLAAGPDGPRTVYARFRDAAQNVSPVYSDTIILDTTPPAGTVTINGGASDTNTISVTLALPASDALSGMGEMSLSNDGQTYSDWESYAAGKPWRLQGGNGAKAVYARFRDTVGNVSAPVSDTIILNTVLPSSAVTALPQFQNTAAFTVTWSGTALGSGLASYGVQYRDGASGSWADWMTSVLSTTHSAVFTGTEGHTYFFQSRARDMAGNVEDYLGGDGHTRTTVDLTPPTGTMTINAGALDSAAVTITLGLSASDLLSGVAQASYSDDGYVWSPWETYAQSKVWSLPSGDGEKPVWGRFRDAAGNVSSPVSDSIRLDTSVDPAYGFSVNDGALFTSQVTVTLSLPANPHTAEMMLSNDGGFRGAVWRPYSAYWAWAITQYGSYVIPRTVYVKYRDVNGNVSAVYQDDIILDLTAPSGSVSIEGAGAAGSVESRGPRVEPNMPHASAWGGDTNPGGRPGDPGPRPPAEPGGMRNGSAAASTVTLRLSASDDVSGIGGMMVSNSPAFSEAVWEPFSAGKGWNLGSGGRVYVTFKDNAGNASPVYAAALSGGNESLPSVVLGAVHPRTGGRLASTETNTTVAFPAGAVGARAEVTLVPSVESSQQSNIGALRPTGKFLTLTARAGETEITAVSRPYTITVGYAARDVAGIDESTLGIYWWNGNQWRRESGSSVDTAAKTVSAALDHLSAFAVLGESRTRTVFLPLLSRSYGSGW